MLKKAVILGVVASMLLSGNAMAINMVSRDITLDSQNNSVTSETNSNPLRGETARKQLNQFVKDTNLEYSQTKIVGKYLFAVEHNKSQKTESLVVFDLFHAKNITGYNSRELIDQGRRIVSYDVTVAKGNSDYFQLAYIKMDTSVSYEDAYFNTAHKIDRSKLYYTHIFYYNNINIQQPTKYLISDKVFDYSPVSILSSGYAKDEASILVYGQELSSSFYYTINNVMKFELKDYFSSKNYPGSSLKGFQNNSLNPVGCNSVGHYLDVNFANGYTTGHLSSIEITKQGLNLYHTEYDAKVGNNNIQRQAYLVPTSAGKNGLGLYYEDYINYNGKYILLKSDTVWMNYDINKSYNYNFSLENDSLFYFYSDENDSSQNKLFSIKIDDLIATAFNNKKIVYDSYNYKQLGACFYCWIKHHPMLSRTQFSINNNQKPNTSIGYDSAFSYIDIELIGGNIKSQKIKLVLIDADGKKQDIYSRDIEAAILSDKSVIKSIYIDDSYVRWIEQKTLWDDSDRSEYLTYGFNGKNLFNDHNVYVIKQYDRKTGVTTESTETFVW